jgi:ComF family protein
MAGQYIETMLAALPSRLRLPSQCEVCRQWGAAALCPSCVGRHAAAVPRCARCGLRLGLAAAACVACLREPPPFARTVCATDYAFPWDRLLTAFKFNGRVELASPLAALMAEAWRGAGPRPGSAAAQLVLPVPLGPARLARRGYNQAWELARRAAATVGLTADPRLLLRHIDATPQAELGRSARQRNLGRAFMVDPRRRHLLQGRPVALVDDVMTTGATARAAAAMLLRAGAAAVDLWVLARTPEA